MRTINIHEAKTQFSQLIEAVVGGEKIIITQAGKPVAQLISLSNKKIRKFGVLKNKIKFSKDFDAPLPEDTLNSFRS